MNILIVEDDFLIAVQITECLERLGHKVVGSFTNGHDALESLKVQRPDLAFMDIELEGAMDGIQCAGVLKNKYGVASIFVTSHYESDTLGASMDVAPLNFLPKPFEDSNIEAAITLAEAALKKAQPQVASSSDTARLGSFTFNFTHNTLKDDGALVSLTNKETALVTLLFKNLSNTVSKEMILTEVYDGSASDDSLRRLVSRTREKLPTLLITASPKNGYYLHTID